MQCDSAKYQLAITLTSDEVATIQKLVEPEHTPVLIQPSPGDVHAVCTD